MDKQTAEYINSLMLDYSAKLSHSVGVVRNSCKEQEANSYIEPASQIMTLMFDILDIVHEQYPDLKPKEFD